MSFQALVVVKNTALALNSTRSESLPPPRMRDHIPSPDPRALRKGQPRCLAHRPWRHLLDDRKDLAPISGVEAILPR